MGRMTHRHLLEGQARDSVRPSQTGGSSRNHPRQSAQQRTPPLQHRSRGTAVTEILCPSSPTELSIRRALLSVRRLIVKDNCHDLKVGQ